MTGGFTLAFALFVALAGAGFLVVLWRNAQTRAISAARDAADKTAEEWGEDTNLTAAFGEVREQSRLADVAVRVVDGHGRTLGVNRRSAPDWPLEPGSGWLTATRPFGPYTIIAGVDAQPVQSDLRREAMLLAALCLPIVGAAALLAWVLVGRTLRPIADLAEQAASATDSLHVHLAEPSPDVEVRRLVTTLNDLLDRLRRNAESREQFYAAAAHELRTPLSVLAGSLELALNRPRTGEEYVETLTELQRETRRLIALSEGLLTLNRLQAQSAVEEVSPVDVAEPCADTLAALASTVIARRLRVESAFREERIETLAPPAHVTMLVRNLIENAVKYAPEGGLVRISVESAPPIITLRVYNDYPLAAQLPLDRLFEPFFRADSSRSSATGGNGLGLAISRQIADAHDWPLTITAEEAGITATVVFPAR